ncbi:MAG: hypothetical protein ABI761_12865 [Saprospiraceae bacterium]
MLLKSRVLETVQSLEDHFTMDELFERISFIENVETGLKDIEDGNTIDEVELVKEVKEWFK